MLLEKLGISDDDLPQFDDFDQLKLKLADIFLQKTRDEWSAIFGKYIWIFKSYHDQSPWLIPDETDACVAPILDKEEAGEHYHNKHRGSFLASGG